MDFDLTEEQRLLKESVDRLVADKYDFEQRKAYAKGEHGFSPQMWTQFAELGLLALPFAEDHGGFGGGPTDLMIVGEALGKALALEPYFATVVLGGSLLRHAGSDEQKAELIPQIAAGELKLAFAHHERAARYELAHVGVKARKDGDGYVIDGDKSLVLNGDAADMLIVSARIAGGERDRGGIGLFLVDARGPGVTRRAYVTQDGLRAAEISFAGARGQPLGTPGEAMPVIDCVADEAVAVLCAEAVGAMAELHALTVDYLKTRKQFGVTIGSFQVLQHRAVDMFVALEQARSITLYATMMAGSDDATERRRAIAAAKVQVGRSIRVVGQGGIQLHGGVGMTMELKAGHYFKRMTMIDMMYGDADYHLARLAEAGEAIAA
jgi:pimeloyl-CoA dehydrogenase small subunit